MRVYLVIGESGEYSDHFSWVDSAHATREGAVCAIEHKTYEVFEHMDGRPVFPTELWDDDMVSVFRHPRRSGDVWLDPNRSSVFYEEATWHIEEYEVVE